MSTFCPTGQLRGLILPFISTAVLQSCVHTAAAEVPTGGESPGEEGKARVPLTQPLLVILGRLGKYTGKSFL